MADKSKIEWTDTTWNPVTGCTKVSAGCDNCYAETLAERFRGTDGHYFEKGFDLVLRPHKLKDPLRWKRPRMIFVNSMSDLFHKKIPTDYLDSIFDIMDEAHWHIFQVLTKRSSLMKKYINDRYGELGAPSHIWLGVSLENDTQLSRLQHLKDTDAYVRFLSIEPLLDYIPTMDLSGIGWVIVGGESGRGARPILSDWVVFIRACHSFLSSGAVLIKRQMVVC